MAFFVVELFGLVLQALKSFKCKQHGDVVVVWFYIEQNKIQLYHRIQEIKAGSEGLEN